MQARDATTLALDLAGFTALTERLAGSGTRGTEQLSSALRGYFAEVAALVAEAGGDPVAFGGDSLTVVYDGPPDTTLEAALGSARRIQRLPSAAPSGAALGIPPARIGVARGVVATELATTGRRVLPVHVGPGLDRAHAAQEGAAPGAIAVHGSAADAAAAASQSGSDRGFGVAGRRKLVADADAGLLLHPALLDRLRRGEAAAQSHRVVTVAFARFAAVAPQNLGAFLPVVTALMEGVGDAGGEVVQVSGGDKGVLAMVVLGAPAAHPDDAVRAVHAMLELRRQQPQVAVGVATGPVFTAVLASGQRLFATHSGVAVNVAARLSQQAHTGQLLVDGPTWDASARQLRQAASPRPFEVKGVSTPVRVHDVKGRRSSAPRSRRATESALVGRAAELASVDRLLDGAAAGRGGSLMITGDSGTGRTRLALEAVDRASTRGFLVIDAGAADHPLSADGTNLRRGLVGGLVGVPRNAPRRALVHALDEALPSVEAPRVVLGRLLGLSLSALTSSTPSSPPDTASPEVAAGLVQAALAGLVRRATRHRPLLVVVENVDRLDHTSHLLVDGLVGATAGCAAAVLLTGDERVPAAPVPDAARPLTAAPTLTLGPLAAGEIAVVAAEAWQQAGGGSPPPWLPGAVVARAGGNPLLATLVARELCATWSPGDPPPSDDDAPGSATSLLLGQVDRLPADERALLTALAVARRPCDLPLLTGLLEPSLEPTVVQRAMTRLSDEGFVTGADSEGERYRLTHDLLRQVVYEATSHAERERLHRRVVLLLGESAEPVAVAEHVAHLEDPELASALALRWFPRAAQAARDGWDLTGAQRWLEALRPLTSGTTREQVDLELLEVLLVAGRAQEVLDRLDVDSQDSHAPSVAGAGSGSADPVTAARRVLVLAEATYSCGQLPRTERAAAEAMRRYDGVDETRYQRAGELLTLARCHQGDLPGAVDAGRALVERAAGGGSAGARANAQAALAVALVLSGRPQEAEQCYEAALGAAVEAGDVVREVHVVSDLAGCAYLTGDLARCVTLLSRARERADEIGYRRHLALNLGNEAQLRVALGDPFATMCAKLAIDRSLHLGDLGTAADALHTWVTARPTFVTDPVLWSRLARVDEALDRLREAALSWAELAVLLARLGRAEEALDAVLRAEGCAQKGDADEVRTRLEVARLLVAARDPARNGAPDAGPGGSSGAPSGGPSGRAVAVEAFGELVEGLAGELEARDAAELALDRWRLSRSPAHHRAAVSLTVSAFAEEPSAVVRAWLRELGERPPAGPEALPPPVGVPRSRTTRRDLDGAFSAVEQAIAGRSGGRDRQ